MPPKADLAIRAARVDPEFVPKQISYSTEQAHHATGISVWKLRRLIRDGLLAARYLGDTVLIDAEDLQRLYDSLPSTRQVQRDCAANER